ncbi:MAG: hypothetical protein MJ239_03630 [Bacilli bacterium]|nr:hypothetical protein [Bacilli bacterium]
MGMIFSTTRVSFDARVYFYGTSICTKSGTGNPYWAFAVNETGYIYAAISDKDYATAKDYAGLDNQYFHIEGTLSLCYGTPQIQVDAWDFIEERTFNVFNSTLDKYVGELQTLENIYDSAKASRINSKGVYYGSLTRFEGVFVAKMDNSVLLFSDGLKTVKLHGSSKISNSFTLGSTYQVYGVPSMYQYCPGFEYVSNSKIEKEIAIPEATKTTTAASTYNWKYQNDTTKHQTSYENLFGDLYTFTGYVSCYMKNSSYYFVLTDELRDLPFTSYTEAINGKALFVKNETENNLYTEQEMLHSFLADHYMNDQKITLTFSPYLWNTQKYFQAYFLPESITPVH